MKKNYLIVIALINLIFLAPLSSQDKVIFQKISRIILEEYDNSILSEINRIGIDSKNNFWVLDWQGCQMIKYDCYGKNPKIIARAGKGPGELDRPDSIFIDEKDNVYVTNILHRVSIFDKNGKFIHAFIPSDGHRPTTCIAVLNDTIFLGGINKGLIKDEAKMIHAYTNKGTYLYSFYDIQEEFYRRNLLMYRSAYFTIGANSTIWAVQPVNHLISIFSSKGNFVRQIGENPSYYRIPPPLSNKIRLNKNLFEEWKKKFTYVRNIFLSDTLAIVCSHTYKGNDSNEYFIDIYDNRTGAIISSAHRFDYPLQQVYKNKFYFSNIIIDKTKIGYKNAIEVYKIKQ